MPKTSQATHQVSPSEPAMQSNSAGSRIVDVISAVSRPKPNSIRCLVVSGRLKYHCCGFAPLGRCARISR